MLKCLITDPPLKQTNFIAFYSDGSGAGIFCWDGGKIKDAEGVFVCRSSETEAISGLIARAGWTGRRGDGVMFVTPVESFARIREVGAPSETEGGAR